MRLSNLLLTAALIATGCASAAGNNPATQPAAETRVLVNEAGIAVQGYDVVAYFDGVATPGDPAFASTHDGAAYRFANAERKSRFDADPAKYAPAYGGYCAFAVAKNAKVAINPQTFRIQDGRLLLFFNDDVDGKTVDTSQSWDNEAADLLIKADENWASLQNR
jgi:YHS domain-containing protein